MTRSPIRTFAKVTDNLPAFSKAINVIASNRVLVGVPADKATREPDDAHGASQEINNAALAYIHDHGAPEANIPARPFMAPGIQDVRGDIGSGLRTAAEAALEGKSDETIQRQFQRVGTIARDAIKSKISAGPFAPLALSTIEARARRGRKGAKQYLKLRGQGVPEDVLNEAAFVKPLIDTGALRNAINFVVRKAMRF